MSEDQNNKSDLDSMDSRRQRRIPGMSYSLLCWWTSPSAFGLCAAARLSSLLFDHNKCISLSCTTTSRTTPFDYAAAFSCTVHASAIRITYMRNGLSGPAYSPFLQASNVVTSHDGTQHRTIWHPDHSSRRHKIVHCT